MNKINTINGVLMASQDELNEHVENGIAHVTEEERTAWNAKADASALSGKVNTAMFNAHKSDAVAHVTAEDRQRWDASGSSGSFQTLNVEGNGTFGGSVTMEQSLNVAGRVTLAGLMQIYDASSTTHLRNSVAVFVPPIPEMGCGYLEFQGGSSMEMMKQNSRPDFLGNNSLLNRSEMDARYGQLSAANTWTQHQTYAGELRFAGSDGQAKYNWELGNDGKLRLAATIATAYAMVIDNDYGTVRIDYLQAGNTTVTGPATFTGGVTMSQSLNVSGETILKTLEILGGQYSVFTVETARATWTNTQAGYFRLQADKAGEQEVILELGNGKVDNRACLIKPGQSGPLTERDVPNCQEGDARWVKFNNTLTDAEYAALAVKEQTTLYITSDGGKVYLGSYALN